jgi:hypothetical protein
MAKTAMKKTASKGTGKKASGGAKGKGAAKGAKKATAKRGSGKRELIAPRGDKRYVRRDGQGQFKESDDVSRSLSADRRKKAKTVVKKGQGDRGDEKR